MDNLEDFIKNNKGEFDREDPRDEIWQRISEQRSKNKTIPIKKGNQRAPLQMMKWAASLLLLATLGYMAYKISAPSTPDEIVATTEASNDLVELDAYYEKQVSMSFTQIEKIVADTAILREVKEELDILDKEKAHLFAEYGKELDDKQVIEALMSTYRMKLEVLENILSLLNENSNDEKDLSI